MLRKYSTRFLVASLSLYLLVATTLPYNTNGDTQSKSNNDDETGKCQMLKTSLTYKQDKAPRDISAVLRVIVEKVNSALDNVIDVEIGWTGGDIHSAVGEHLIQSTVTRLLPSPSEDDNESSSSKPVTQCYTVPFTILDTNECTLPSSHPMHHQCTPPAICVNTLGSYECVCPSSSISAAAKDTIAPPSYFSSLPSSSPWEISLPNTPHCPSHPSTHSCCPASAHSINGASCRQSFQCPIDPCTSQSHDCTPPASCIRGTHPSDDIHSSYTCHCPAPFIGNGKTCRKTDSLPRPTIDRNGALTPYTKRHMNDMCGCTRPFIDACDGYTQCDTKANQMCITSDDTNHEPKCVCLPGFIDIEPYGCVDETPPKLHLRCDPNGDKVTRLTQGMTYKECAVDIIDSNAEEYMRSLKMRYSVPLSGCLTQVGEFQVNYTVATPWTSPPFVGVVRTVVVEDLNECALEEREIELLEKKGCQMLIPRCDYRSGATCVNTVGSYTCQCPEKTKGDGFLTLESGEEGDMKLPVGYQGGTGCRDVSIPLIELKGPNPKVFKVPKCGGLLGVLSDGLDDDVDEEEEIEKRRLKYEADIKHILKTTHNLELCADSSTTSTPTICHTATDTTYQGIVDLTSRVAISEPIPIPPPPTDKSTNSLWWRVAYDVTDDAGNQAQTQYRHIKVEELSLKQLRQEHESNAAAAKKITTTTTTTSSSQLNTNNKQECPPCPPVTPCPNKLCPDTCPNKPPSCPSTTTTTTASSSSSSSDLISLVHTIISSLETAIPTLIYFLTICVAIAIIALLLSKTLLRDKRAHDDRERMELLTNSITYYSPQGGMTRGGQSMPLSSSRVTPSGSGTGERNGSHNQTPLSSSGGAPPTSSLLTSPLIGRVGDNVDGRSREMLSPNKSNNLMEDIYERSFTPITPSRSDGRERGQAGQVSWY